jgi:hypothetical protein
VPNPYSLLIFTFVLFLTSLLAQVIQPTQYEESWLIRRIGLSSIPPLLGFILSRRFYKEEKIKKRDVVFEYMAIVSGLIMGILAISYTILLLLLYVYSSIASISFYFLSVGLWGIIGITLADSGVFYTAEIKYSLNGDEEFTSKLKRSSSQFISQLFTTTNRRMLSLGLMWFVIGVSMIFLNSIENKPVTI